VGATAGAVGICCNVGGREGAGSSSYAVTSTTGKIVAGGLRRVPCWRFR
jgi:hypothetical protein